MAASLLGLVRGVWRGNPRATPARFVLAGFAAAILFGTLLLLLPIAREGPAGAGFVTALFTATSAVCVTGLIVVDTPGYWTTFGEVVVLGLLQIGGFGIMTSASLLGLLISRRFGLRLQVSAQTETKTMGLGDVRRVVTNVALISLAFEVVTAVLLAGRFVVGYHEPLARAAYLGVFHAVSAFNNAGFALFSNSLMRFTTDAWICLPVLISVIAGGLGFPVLIELGRKLRAPRPLSLHTKITLAMTGILISAGTLLVLAIEWSRPATLGPLGVPGKLLAGFFQAVTPRTAGFNTLDYGQMNDATLLGTDVLMFIGGSSAGTAGGIKLTTFALLGYTILAEIRGEYDVRMLGRRVERGAQRQALTVALLGVGAVVVATLILLVITPYRLPGVLFEVTSAFATVGLSTGITDDLPTAGDLIIIALMYIGRLGPITLASGLALRQREIRYRLPEERPIIG